LLVKLSSVCVGYWLTEPENLERSQLGTVSSGVTALFGRACLNTSARNEVARKKDQRRENPQEENNLFHGSFEPCLIRLYLSAQFIRNFEELVDEIFNEKLCKKI
jgi:hypothetical protein